MFRPALYLIELNKVKANCYCLYQDMYQIVLKGRDTNPEILLHYFCSECHIIMISEIHSSDILTVL